MPRHLKPYAQAYPDFEMLCLDLPNPGLAGRHAHLDIPTGDTEYPEGPQTLETRERGYNALFQASDQRASDGAVKAVP